MHLRFDANQDYQLAAMAAVVRLFEGQARVASALEFSLSAGIPAVPNRLDLSADQLLANLRAAQSASGIAPDPELLTIAGECTTADGARAVTFPNFSVEMETGTGKTYVYLRTAMELFRVYGMRKFIVVVPSVAIREGVLKTLEVTRGHFAGLYDNAPCRYCVYDSSNLSQVRQFALSDGGEFLIMTIDSFNKASNLIHQSTDRLQGETPVHLVQATRPVLILDEPQNFESELRVRALVQLNPLLALRYSATHRNPYNVVYRLTPYEAYRQGLVKKIEVAGVKEQASENRVFLRLDGFKTSARSVAARIAVHRLLADGQVKEAVVSVVAGNSLEAKANRAEYAPFVVEEIDVGAGLVRFANRIEIRLGQAVGPDRERIFAEQIRYTIEKHFRRQRALRGQGIKVLSLFFIDRVANYRGPDGEPGVIRQLFDRAFADLQAQYDEWREVQPATVQAAYFAQSRRKSGEVVLEDSTSGEARKDEEAYDLIMRNKERLLSFDEATCFIFSHSALREGWDNPNIFQICTLNQSVSEVRKRQEIGRGVRLAVNQGGERVWDETVNVLTVAANQSYEAYCRDYQAEVEQEFGSSERPPKPGDARHGTTVRWRKEFQLRPEFRELWNRIARRTRYAVRIDTARLLEEVVADLAIAAIRPPRIVVSTGRLDVAQGQEAFDVLHIGEKLSDYDGGANRGVNLLYLMEDLMERTSPPMRVTRRTLSEIVRRCTRLDDARRNPHEFATVCVRLIKNRLREQLVDGIRYEKLDEWYRMDQFALEFQSWAEHLVPSDRSPYDHVAIDSEVERRFAEDLERREDVKLFLKLPGWFVVPTPIGDYNPDWAVVLEPRDQFGRPTGEELLYLVRETKDSADLTRLRPEEAMKVRCGEKHFSGALGVPYRVVTRAADVLP
jgi:type III restriction enzyme